MFNTTSNAKSNKKTRQEQPQKVVTKTVTPSFTAAGNQPTVQVVGNKALKESLIIGVMEPGKDTMESITIHRPIGLWNPIDFADEGDWVGTYTESVPHLLNEGENDLKRADAMFSQYLNAVLEEQEYISTSFANGKRTINYAPAQVIDARDECEQVIVANVASRPLKDGITQEDYVACTTRIKSVLDSTQGSRNEVKQVIDNHIDSIYKNTHEYYQYREELDVYNSLPAKQRRGKTQPKAPTKGADWTDYLPPILLAAENERKRLSRTLRQSFYRDRLVDGTLRETVDPYTRNAQRPIHGFRGLSLQEVKNRVFGAFHFGENLHTPPPGYAPGSPGYTPGPREAAGMPAASPEAQGAAGEPTDP